jgi:hypothetical protein
VAQEVVGSVLGGGLIVVSSVVGFDGGEEADPVEDKG